MSSVLIVHSAYERALARELAKTLKKFAMEVAINYGELKREESLRQKVYSDIDALDYVVVLLSERLTTLEWCKQELHQLIFEPFVDQQLQVLSVLAEDCTFPNLLTTDQNIAQWNKTCIDMSTPERFEKNLHQLLAQLDVDPYFVAAIADGKPVDEVAPYSRQALELVDGLLSENIPAKYEALKTLKHYRHRDLLLTVKVIEQVIDCLGSDYPIHIRLEAIQVFHALSDINFVEKIAPLIDDDNRAVAQKAVGALAQLKAHDYGALMLSIFQDPERSHLHSAVLRFFKQVCIKDDADALSIVSAIESWRSLKPNDKRTELNTILILAKQWDGSRDYLLEQLLDQLSSENPEIRRAVLERIRDAAREDEIWIRDRAVKYRLEEKLLSFMDSGTHFEVSTAWISGLLWYALPNQKIWPYLRSASEEMIQTMFFEMEVEAYNLNSVIDEPEGIRLFEQLLQKVSGHLRECIFNALVEIDSADALIVLAEQGYKPESWKATAVLRSLSSREPWDQRFDTLLEAALKIARDQPYEEALALLAQYQAGKIVLGEMINQFPRKNLSGPSRFANPYKIQKTLESIKARSHTANKHRLTSLIEAIR